jgi:D-hydroxyproline dehydrogenase subunit gamma
MRFMTGLMMSSFRANRIPAQRRGSEVTIQVNGRPVRAHAGEMLAAALMAAGEFRMRESTGLGMPRGAFCLMGVCQECLVRIAGRTRQACLVDVVEGLNVELFRTELDPR